MARSWLPVLICGSALITITMGLRQGFGLFLPSISQEIGAGRELFALAIAFQNLVWGFSSPFFGALADRFGARSVAALGGLLYTLGLVVMGLSLSREAVVAGQFLIGVGLGGAGFSVVLGAVGQAAPPEKRSFALGIVTAGGSFGQFAFVPLAALLLEGFGPGDALLGLALIAVTMIGLALGLRPQLGAQAAMQWAPQTLVEALREALSHRSYLLLTTGFFVCGFQVVFIATHLPAFLADRGVAPGYAAWALALVGLFNIIGSLSAGWLGGRVSKRDCLGVLARHDTAHQRLDRGLLRHPPSGHALWHRLLLAPDRLLPGGLAGRLSLRPARLLRADVVADHRQRLRRHGAASADPRGPRRAPGRGALSGADACRQRSKWARRGKMVVFFTTPKVSAVSIVPMPGIRVRVSLMKRS
jgi:MFS family permease